ncbi:hypothetical protein CVT25_009269 [Psilocybe cyanescens]|uniref:Protein kinase domain-containing protein n=1 Tax=Psilocybe cyanescens TaxID=93625 RepID=A0A409WW67_PSICY|nr:hypothetical protein CVT25_009269 [Psilocybe cyanescens]
MLTTFACYFPAENPLFIPINIHCDDLVQELSKEIIVDLHSRGRTDVKIDDLRLFKQADVPFEPEDTLQSRSLQWLHNRPANSRLGEMKTLSDVFPNGPHEEGQEHSTHAVGQMLKLMTSAFSSNHPTNLQQADVPLEPKETRQPRSLRWLHNQPADSQLDEAKTLSDVFPNGPHGKDRLDIIVADAEGMAYPIFQFCLADFMSVLEIIKGLDDPYNVYNSHIRKALHKSLDRLSLSSLPSDVISSSHKLAEVLDPKSSDYPKIHLGRPGGAPAVIFNPALAILQQDLDDPQQVLVDRADVERAFKYIQCAVRFYKDEASRQNEIKMLVDNMIGEAGNWKPTGNASWGKILFLIFLELKNTWGLGGDATCQAVIDYSKIISRDEYKKFRLHCNFPAVLIGVTANRLEISVAVCVGPVYVTKLLTLELTLGFHASESSIRLARVFKALSRCRENLKDYYDGVIKLEPPKLSCLYPSPAAIDPSQKLPKLTYRQLLTRDGQPTSALVDLGNVCTAMYIASLALGDGTSKEVIVKFTARYNEAAHRILAEAGFAPTLHFCGRVAGDLYMIVMDRVAWKSIWQLKVYKTPVPAIVAKQVEQAINLLHKEDIVFGDLRTNNILYVASESKAVIVDFDWAGTDKKSRYPVTLNPSSVWAEDVIPYGLMHKNHDLWQLEQLKAVCESND